MVQTLGMLKIDLATPEDAATVARLGHIAANGDQQRMDSIQNWISVQETLVARADPGIVGYCVTTSRAFVDL